MKPANFVRQVYLDRRDNGGMFKSEVGVQEVSTTNPDKNRFRAYVTDSWGGGIQCFRDTPEEARVEVQRLWYQFTGGQD